MGLLTRVSLKNPVLVFLLALIVCTLGVLCATSLKEELMPDIAFPVIAVVTPYPGASPDSVSEDVSTPLETALKNVNGVKTVTSTSVQNVSEITLELNMNANLNTVEQKVQQIVSGVKLPSTALQPTIQRFSFNASPVVNFTVASNDASNSELRRVVNETIIPALQGVAGVAEIQTGGAADPRVNIEVNESKLSSHNLTLQQLIEQLQASNVTMPLGAQTISGKVSPLQLMSPFSSVADIQSIPISIPTNPARGLQDVGKGMQSLGNTTHELGKGVSSLSQGFSAIQAENELLSALETIQGQLFGAELELAKAEAAPRRQRDKVAIAKLQETTAALEREQINLNNQLKELQGKLSASGMISGVSRGSALSQTGGAMQPSIPSAAGTKSTNLETVPLSELADVSMAPPDTGSINRTNGQQSVFVGVVKTENANTVTMAKAVNAELSRIEKQLPSGIHIVPLFDSSTMIVASINGMLREAILGAIFAVVVILFFLRNWRTTVIAVVSIPLSLLIALMVLNRLNITLNIMTLGGMAIATGRVVDDSIVVIENIFRAWRHGLGHGKSFVYSAAREVGQAITSSTITTVAVFVPLGFVSGVVGKIFTPFAVTVVCALLSSLLVALTVVPALAWLLVARRPDTSAHHGASAPVRGWQGGYQKFLQGALNHKVFVLCITLVVFLASLAVLPFAGSTFIPASKEKFATIAIKMPIGTPRGDTDAKARQVETVLYDMKETIRQWNTEVGSDPGQLNMAGGVDGENQANIFLDLQPTTDVDTFVPKLRRKLCAISAPAVIQVKSLVMGGATGGFAVTLTSPSETNLKSAATRVTAVLQQVHGLANVNNNLSDTRPQLNIIPKSTEAALNGLTPYQIASSVQSYVQGQNIGNARIGGEARTVWVSVKPTESLNSLVRVEDMPIVTPLGKTVKLRDIATVQSAPAPVQVEHQDGQPYASITADFTSNNTGSISRLALRKVNQLDLPSDVLVQVAGDTQQMNQSFHQLIEAILISALLVYLVMMLTFGGWAAPFAILFSMPVALIGAFFGTVLGGQPISVSSLIGILMLMGIVVTNAIVMVDRVEQQRKQGLSVRKALLEAGTTRLRPILMTAIATIGSLIPLAIGFAEGALISQGLAVVVIGGLVSSTLLTLVIVPVMYELLHFRTHHREERAGRKARG